jgi:phospholipid/cholesterol/gamma-HCH transport system permease protein
LIEQLAVPARAVGGFVEMSLETFRAVFRRPFQFREFLDQTWMIAQVSLIPTLRTCRDTTDSAVLGMRLGQRVEK